MHWETSDGRRRIYVVEIDGLPHYRLMMGTGHWLGDYRTLEDLIRVHDTVELADLRQVED